MSGYTCTNCNRDAEKCSCIATQRLSPKYKTRLQIAMEALKEIAKPALGGKQQQWIAKKALKAMAPPGKAAKL